MEMEYTQITHRYFVTFSGKTIETIGETSPLLRTITNLDFAEFDTESELNAFIEANGLVEVTDETY